MKSPEDLNHALDELAHTPSWCWPTDAVDTVHAALRSDDIRQRSTGLDLVVDLIDDELARELLQILIHDPELELRARAAIALGPVLEECDLLQHDPSPLDEPVLSHDRFLEIMLVLKQLYHDGTTPKLLRRRALEAAVRASQPWHHGAVRASYLSDDIDWRATAVFCMAWLPGFDEAILEALHHDTPSVKTSAAHAAGMRELVEAGPILLDHAANPNQPIDLRLAAIVALTHLQPPGTIKLLRVLSRDPLDAIARVAADALDELALWDEQD